MAAASSWFGKMLGKALTLGNLNDLLVQQLEDLYSAEDQLIKALPKMAQAASSSRLKTAFEAHLQDTMQHKQRLEKALQGLGAKPGGEKCEAMAGLISEGNEIATTLGDPDVKDAALIAAAQRVEHYEIAGYGCARTFARRLGRDDIAQLLQETLQNEVETDRLLTEIAESSANPAAAATAKE
ncbi:MAG TPA: ferritin-like domain-containing protein [Pirellulales bacterium]|nr:ferritin-like domain-containing protein [Pirellulales bacterium]